MKIKTYCIKRIISLAILTWISINSYPAEPCRTDTSLYKTILLQDSLLFNSFNTRDIEHFKMFFTDDLEIYQDNIGVRDFNKSMEAFNTLFQGNNFLTRKLMKESLEVYPIKNFGAIEIGQHTFCHMEDNKSDCGTYKFVHIWKNQNGTWKISRIITYDH